MSKTLVIIKPDSYDYVTEIMEKFSKKGYKTEEFYCIVPDKLLIQMHYEEHKNRPDFDELCNQMANKKMYVVIFSNKWLPDHKLLIEKTREFIKDVIRKEYGKNLMNNAIHASDSIESFNREYKLWIEQYMHYLTKLAIKI